MYAFATGIAEGVVHRLVEVESAITLDELEVADVDDGAGGRVDFEFLEADELFAVVEQDADCERGCARLASGWRMDRGPVGVVVEERGRVVDARGNRGIDAIGDAGG